MKNYQVKLDYKSSSSFSNSFVVFMLFLHFVALHVSGDFNLLHFHINWRINCQVGWENSHCFLINKWYLKNPLHYLNMACHKIEDQSVFLALEKFFRFSGEHFVNQLRKHSIWKCQNVWRCMVFTISGALSTISLCIDTQTHTHRVGGTGLQLRSIEN